MKGISRVCAFAVAAGLLATTVAGCSRSLASEDIERELERQLSTQDFVPEVTCDEDLPGEVGATIKCETTLPDDLDVDIVVTARQVDGDQVRYDFEIQPVHGELGPTPTSGSPDTSVPSTSG
ncbi:MAG: DUF4333 domain-containing protein [Nocardioidaceae bacterium]